ncbi:hypothetical protein D3C76_1566160 [compost metagenome]
MALKKHLEHGVVKTLDGIVVMNTVVCLHYLFITQDHGNDDLFKRKQHLTMVRPTINQRDDVSKQMGVRLS